MRIFAATITLASLSLAACDGSVITADAAASGAAATSGAGTGGSAGAGGGSAGEGGGSAGAGGSVPCVPEPPQPFDPDAGVMKATCADLAMMTVRNPVLHPEGDDDALSAGESAILHVDLEEIAGKGFFWYPEVKFSSDTPGVSVGAEFPLYGIAACQSVPASTSITVAPGVPKGTVAHVSAKVGMLGADCPGSPAISVPIAIH